MSDKIAQALNRGDKLDDPNILREDDPPMLRFERTTLEDRHITEETGRYGYKDAILVHVRAYGDLKTEVPYVAWTTVRVPEFETVMIQKQVPIIVQDEKGNERTEYRVQEVPEQRATFHEEEVYPWFDQLDGRLRNNHISQAYRDHCRRAFEQWREHGDVPLEGSPVAEWRMVSPAQQARLIDAGYNTIEKVAAMTEDGMTVVGMGARDFKKKAQAWLSASNDSEAVAANVVKLETRASQAEQHNKTLQEKLAQLEGLIEKMQQKGVEDE